MIKNNNYNFFLLLLKFFKNEMIIKNIKIIISFLKKDNLINLITLSLLKVMFVTGR
jgi:hypothetical protein